MWLKGKQQSCFGWMMTHLHTGWEILYVRNERARLRAKTINDRFYFSSSAQTGWKQLSYRWIMSDDGGSEVSVTQRAHVHTHACTHTHTEMFITHSTHSHWGEEAACRDTPQKMSLLSDRHSPPHPHSYTHTVHNHTFIRARYQSRTETRLQKFPKHQIKAYVLKSVFFLLTAAFDWTRVFVLLPKGSETCHF